MKLHAFSSQAPNASPEARQGLNARIVFPKREIFPELRVLDFYGKPVPEILDTSLKNPKVLPQDLQHVLGGILKIYQSSIDWFVNDSSIEQNISDQHLQTYVDTFWKEFNTFIKPDVNIHAHHTDPIIRQEEGAVVANSSLINPVPLLELNTPSTPYRYVTATIQSIQDNANPSKDPSYNQKLIGLKLYAGLEDDEHSKIIRIKGRTENSNSISEYIRACIEATLHDGILNDERVGRVQFWDQNKRLIPNSKYSG